MIEKYKLVYEIVEELIDRAERLLDQQGVSGGAHSSNRSYSHVPKSGAVLNIHSSLIQIRNRKPSRFLTISARFQPPPGASRRKSEILRVRDGIPNFNCSVAHGLEVLEILRRIQILDDLAEV